MFLFSQLHFIELTVDFRYFLGYKKIGTEHWAVCAASNCNTNCTKGVNNETLTLNP